jgi:hypothetical protein
MINGESTVGVAPDAIGAEMQLKRLVFQPPGLDEQSGHISSETDLMLHRWRTKVERKMGVMQPELWR